MSGISRINPGRLHLDSGQVILRARDYQHFVQSRQIIDSAHDQASSIRDQAASAYEEARRNGYRKGWAEGEKKIISRHIAFVRNAIDFIAQLETDINFLVKDAIAKIIGQMDIDELTLRIVAKAIAQYGSLPEVRLLVAPAQENMVREALEKITRERTGGMKFIRVQPDSQLQKGDCLLESPIGSVDAGLNTQLTAIREALDSSNKSLHLKYGNDEKDDERD